MRGRKAKALRRMVRQLEVGEDTMMMDKGTARFFWKLPRVTNQDGTETSVGVLKTAINSKPVIGARYLCTTHTATYRPGGMKHLTRLAKRQLKEVRND